MKIRFYASLTALVTVLATVIALHGFTQPSVALAVDDTPDCDTVAIIRCGAMTPDALRSAYDTNTYGDLPTVFNAFGISRADLDGSFVDGIVWRDGRVTVGNKTVATDAYDSARNWGGTPIAGTHNAAVTSVSTFVTDGQTAHVRMVNDTFAFAVVKTCGNPVKATPVVKPKPQPVPAPAVMITKKVDAVDNKTVNVGQEFTYQLSVKNTGNVDLANVVVTDKPQTGVALLKTGSSLGTISSNQWSYTIPSLASQASVTLTLTATVPSYVAGTITNTACVDTSDITGSPDDCDDATVDVPKPSTISVCNPATGEIITVDEADKDKYKPATDTACADIHVCVLSSKTIKTIKKADYAAHPELYSDDVSKCDAPKVLTSTTTIASTGPTDIILGATGIGSVTAAGYYFQASRRRILASLRNK